MIVLTLVSMIGLALPSSVMIQRKMAKGSKKNPSSSSQKEETVIPVEVMVSQTMPVEEIKERVTEIVRDILEEQQETDHNNRRVLYIQPSRNLFSVHTTDTTPTECAPKYSAAAACYNAIIRITSDENHAARISILNSLLYKDIRRLGITLTSKLQTLRRTR